MRLEITAHTRDSIPEDRLIEMAADSGVSLHKVKPLEMKWSYILHREAARGARKVL